MTCYVIDAPEMYGRSGNPYLGPDGKDWPDNHFRFALLSWVAAWFAGGDGGWRWRRTWSMAMTGRQGWLRPTLRWAAGATPTILTIHNIAYQGLFPASLLGRFNSPIQFLGERPGILQPDRLPEGGPVLFRPDHHGQPDPMPRKSSRPTAATACMACWRPAPAISGASSTGWTTTSGRRTPIAHRPALRCRPSRRQGGQQVGLAGGDSAWTSGPKRRCSAWSAG